MIDQLLNITLIHFFVFRVQADSEVAVLPVVNKDGVIKAKSAKLETKTPEPSSNMAIQKIGKSLKAKVLGRVYSEDYEKLKYKILDPKGKAIRQWSKIFVAVSVVSLFVDPLFFFLPIVTEDQCVEIGLTFETILTTMRSVVDVFYVIQIFVRFRTAYVAPSSRVLGRGELVIDSSKIASRYLRQDFWIDLFVALPLPQVSH